MFNKFKYILSLGQFEIENETHRLLALSFAIKSADIGHGAKRLMVHKMWTRRICEEFYVQGDLESNYKIRVSPLCDRTKNKVAKSQHGFLTMIVQPLYIVLDEFLQE